MSQVWKVLGVMSVLGGFGGVEVSDAAIVEQMTNNKIESPAYLLDYQENDGDVTTLRHGLKTTLTSKFTRTFVDPVFSGTYRMAYQLLDKQGNPVDLVNGLGSDPTTAVGPSFSLGNQSNNYSETVTQVVYPDPVDVLSNTSTYKVTAKLQRLLLLSGWSDVASPSLESAPEFVYEFTQAASGDATINVRAVVKDIAWIRQFAVATSATKGAFRASANVVFARFDDWEAPVSNAVTTLVLDFDLIDASNGDSIPLENNGRVTQNWTAPSYKVLLGGKKSPRYQTMNIVADIKALTQLRSGSETYILRCTVKHVETLPFNYYTDGVVALSDEPLLHFNGSLMFGTRATTFNDVSNTPAFGAGGWNYVETQLQIPGGAGSFPQNANYVFGTNSLLNVKLYDDGHAEVINGIEFAKDPADPVAPVVQTNGNVSMTYGSTRLSSSGFSTTSVKVQLPQGNIYLADTTIDSQRGEDFIVSPFSQSLQDDLNIASDVNIQFGDDAAMVDESHPLKIRTKRVTVTPTGRLEFGDIQGVTHIHTSAYNALETELANGTLEPKDVQGRELHVRASNDRYWKLVSNVVSPEVVVTAAGDGSSRMTAGFDIDPEPYETHFPVYAKIDWGSVSSIALEEGVMAASNELGGVNLVDQPYYQTCPEDSCGDGVPKQPQSVQPNGGLLQMTLSGGLYQKGSLTNPKHLAWGARGDGMGGISPNYPYAHRSSEFSEADVYIPGYQLYASDNPLPTTAPYNTAGGDTAPSALLLAGYNGDANSRELYFPTSGEYIKGLGYYPGVNVEVASSGQEGASRIGGITTDYPYVLVDGGSSKYYTRCAGVFGRQVAEEGSFNPSLNMYGYDFELTSFQLTFIASEPLDSWVNGAVAVTGHSDFTQRFTGLKMNCFGELKAPTIDPTDTDNKNLVYWGSQFIPKALSFELYRTNSPGDCPELYSAFLTMGIETKVAHIPNKLYGTFAFNPVDGNLLTQITGSAIGVDSELRIPANIQLDGPSKDYTLVTTGKLRFSNPDENPNASIGNWDGFVSFGATINVPYFRDFQVQMMTSANDTPSAAVYLTPGWTSGGKTFFSHTDFDPNHTSWPKGSISIGEYQTPDTNTNPTYLIKAEQDLFGLIALSYPMKWDDAARSFTSMNPKNDDLLVINVDHQVKYLDAGTAQVTFGATYDGLPQISLSNMLNEQIDEAASAVSSAISAPLKNAIDEAFIAFNKQLADSLDAVVDPIVDEAATQVLDPLYDQLKIAYDAARANPTQKTWADFKVSLNNAIAAQLYNAPGANAGIPLRNQLDQLSAVAGDAAALTTQLNDSIEQIIIGIDAITAQVELVNGVPQFNLDANAIVGAASDGLLKKTSGEYQIVQSLIRLLLKDLVEPELAAILQPLLTDLTSGVNADLNALMKEIEPALGQITAALLQVRQFLVEVRTEIITPAGKFIQDFQTLVDQAKAAAGEFDKLQSNAANRVTSFIEDYARDLGIDLVTGTTPLDSTLDLFEEFDKEAFVSLIKTEIKDAILESELLAQYQFLLRQQLYELQNKMEQTVASVLSQITTVMKEIVSSTVGALEKEINPLLGQVNEYMGAASVVGYADFNGDSLRKLRMDASMQFKIPDELVLNTYLEINAQTSSDDGNGCVGPGERAVEVTVGATDVPMDWISKDLRANLAVKMSLKDTGSGLRPNGVGGSFELTGGEIDFQTFKITTLAATVAIGGDQAYLGARATGILDSYQVSLGVFFGRTCDVAPLVLVDEQVGTLFSSTMPLTGAYVYGEVWLPISELVLGIPASCLFDISAGVGTGVGFFLDDSLSPIFVGKMFAGISGEALCVISIKGTVTMVGIVQDGSFSASGVGKLKGKAGACPFCIKFSASARVSYSDGDWDVDY